MHLEQPEKNMHFVIDVYYLDYNGFILLQNGTKDKKDAGS